MKNKLKKIAIPIGRSIKGLPVIKLTKLKESDNPYHPNNIEKGFEVEGLMLEKPKIGFPFWVGGHWRTSLVKKILSEDTFETMNSIYKIEIIK